MRSEGLVGISDGSAKNIIGLLDIVEKKAPAEVFGKIPGAAGDSRAAAPSFAVGIGGVQVRGNDYAFEDEKRYLINISSEPDWASLSFNRIPDARCTKTPCSVELAGGNVRVIAVLGHRACMCA